MALSKRWIVVAAALVTAAAGPGVAAGGASSKSLAAGTYKGRTNNGLPVTFRIGGGRVRNFSVTVHALCVSVLAPDNSHLDSVLHQITPPPMRLSRAGRFAAQYKIKTNSTRAKVDGQLKGRTASGHYSLSYSKTGGSTSSGILIIYACQEKGTWKATLR